MAEGKSCACTGIRHCLKCERKEDKVIDNYNTFVCCHLCGEIKQSVDLISSARRPPLLRCINTCREVPVLSVKDTSLLNFETVTVYKEFLIDKEESQIVKEIDRYQWVPSQSGRHKQDFGPKVNFKRQKVKPGRFSGLPPFSQTLVEKVQKSVLGLADFFPVELCNLEYVPERGSAIDPHLDDSWLWGKRLITINLLSDTFLRFTCGTDQLLVPQPRRSLIVVSGSARTIWKHSISREHIVSRRLSITLRELSSIFLPGGEQEELGRELFATASSFSGKQCNGDTVLLQAL